MVGIDHIIIQGEYYKLSSHILNYLVDIGYFTLSHIRRPLWRNMDCSYWLTSKDLGLVHDSTHESEAYIKKLNLVGCRISNGDDSLTWTTNPQTGNIYAKATYQAIVHTSSSLVHKWWYKIIWKWMIPLKFKCFIWMALQNCLKTWDNLIKKMLQGC